MVAVKKAAPAKRKSITKKRGRPTKNTPAIRMEVCKRLSDGEPLAQICRDARMPCPTTVREWMKIDGEFSDSIAGAREDGEDKIAADCLLIADDSTNDYMEQKDGEGAVTGYKLNSEHVQRSKLRIETRLKLLAKWNPKKYGDRSTVGLEGSDGGPLELTIIREVVKASA